jgi:hypothetical protein
MSKMIKFNLTLNKCPVRDLDDLRENFNIDDLLDAYHSKVLHRWLEVRGLLTELDKLIKIKSLDNKVIATELCRTFYVDVTKTDIDAAVYPFNYRQQQRKQLEQMSMYKTTLNVIIDDYHLGYKNLCNKMREKSEDYYFLKSAVNDLWENYSQLLIVDFENFFSSFNEFPLVLFSMLSNNNYRQSGIFDDEDIYDKSYKEILFDLIPSNKTLAERHHGYYQSYAGETDGYWKDIVPKGKKCLILRMEARNYIRNSGLSGEELDESLVNNKFLILDGIDYKSNNANHTLVYMVI